MKARRLPNSIAYGIMNTLTSQLEGARAPSPTKGVLRVITTKSTIKWTTDLATYTYTHYTTNYEFNKGE